MSVETNQLVDSILLNRDTSIPFLHTTLTTDEVIHTTNWKEVPYGPHPIAGVSCHFGYPVSNAELSQYFGDQAKKLNNNEGFKFEERYLYPPSVDQNQAAQIEHMIGVEAIKRASIMRGIDPKDISFLFVSNTFPGSSDTRPNDTFGRDIASAAGAINAKTVELSFACGAGGRIMFEAAKLQEQHKGKIVGLIAVEGLSRMQNKTQGDKFIPDETWVFGNTAAAMFWQLGTDLHIRPGLEHVKDDKIGVITGPCFFTFSANQENGSMVTQDVIRQKLPNPENHNFTTMKLRLTTEWTLGDPLDQFTKGHQYLYPNGNSGGPILFVGHYPEETIYKGLLRKASRNLRIPQETWVAPRYLTQGNGSSATYPENLLAASQSGIIDKFKKVESFVFGAGENEYTFELDFTKSPRYFPQRYFIFS